MRDNIMGIQYQSFLYQELSFENVFLDFCRKDKAEIDYFLQ